MKKIAITIRTIQDIHCNGHIFNNLLWYDFLTECGYDVTFVYTHKDETKHDIVKKYKFMCITEMLIESMDTNVDVCGKYPEMFDFDFIFCVGVVEVKYFMIAKTKGIRIVFIDLGSTYHNDIMNIVGKECISECWPITFDEVWISPHFAFSKEYLKIRFSTEKVFVCPYFWKDTLFASIKDKVLVDTNHLRIGIVEPNIFSKNCLVPMAICEKAEQYVDKVMLLNAYHLKENPFMKSFIMKSNLCKKQKITLEGRIPLPLLFTQFCNCVVSCVVDCDLNYVFLECFYLGIPLIHNSPMLKDYGYYYPGLDVSKGAEQIINVTKNHDRNQYIKKHIPLLNKYSIHNPVYKTWVQEKLKGNIDFSLD